MADTVGCTGCHDFTRKHSREAVSRACLACHEPPYTALLTEWTRGFDAELRSATAAVRGAEEALARARRTRGRAMPDADALLNEARKALGLVRAARSAHNPLAADALLSKARANADAVGRLASPRALAR
jgi:hypothetical protein